MVVVFDIKLEKIVKLIGSYDDYTKYGPVSSIDISR